MEVMGVTKDAEPVSTDVALDDSDIAVVARGGEDIVKFLADDPNGEERLLGVLDRRLDNDIDEQTWSRVYASLATLVGEGGTNLISWAATVEPNLIDMIDPHVPSEAAALMRRVAATYGAELRNAYERSTELPNNWRAINREVYQDLTRNQAYIRIRIEKYNDEKVLIEGPGDSILGLAKNIIVALRLVGSRQEFSEARIQEYLEEADELLKILRPETNVPTTSVAGAANGPAGEVTQTG
jgi:hypothetical protein